MTLNRASKKEADSRLSLLRKQVSVNVFTVRFEDETCRLARTAAEELAESTSRLSVEINDAGTAGDLSRKFRIDAVPAVVVSAKDAPDLRLYGAPVAFGLVALLDAISAVGTAFDPGAALLDGLRSSAARSDRGYLKLDLVCARRNPLSAEAAASLWRLSSADYLSGERLRIIPSVRLIDDFPLWAANAPAAVVRDALPFLVIEGATVLAWPFTSEDLLRAAAAR